MEFSIKNVDLIRIIEICENFSGTIEPGYRFMSLYYNKGLKIFSSEGCAKIEINFPTVNIVPFSGTYIISIDYIKSLVDKKGSDDEYISFQGDKRDLRIKTSEDQLILKNCCLEGFPEMERKFEKLFKISRRDFIDKLNFVSSINYDEVPADIERIGDKVLFSSNSGNITLLSFYEYSFEKDDNFNFVLPYTTSRHLVKSMEKIKTEELFFGEGISEGGIKTGKILISFCTDKNLHESSFKDLEIFNDRQSRVIKKKVFSDCLKKVGNFIRRGYKAILISDKDGLRVYLKLGETEFQTFISRDRFEDFVTIIQPHLLRSAISRLKTQNLYLFKRGDFLYISNKNREKVIIIPIMKN